MEIDGSLLLSLERIPSDGLHPEPFSARNFVLLLVILLFDWQICSGRFFGAVGQIPFYLLREVCLTAALIYEVCGYGDHVPEGLAGPLPAR
jgi:hypothetical protein